jgi:UMF1 family MFS transporter
MAAAALAQDAPIVEPGYRGRVWAWAMYDWANSAFATTILAAVLPVYFSTVAAATLPSEATATGYWSLGLSAALLITAVMSPFLGTVSDVRRSKKSFLAIFAILGIVATGLLVTIERGDWVAALLLFVVARVGFSGSYTFYDSLLPHVARPDDQDRVSSLGYALGYLGGGVLLAINIIMIFVLPGTWGPRLSFLSVALWWAVFSIPLFRRVPEPRTVSALMPGDSVVRASLRRQAHTFREIRKYRELFRYLIAFLLYNDAIGTIIGLAVIYGAELGFGSTELVLALLLVQFVGIPFSLIFGSLPNGQAQRRPFFLAFIVFNIIALPLVGVGARALLPADLSGAPPAAFVTQGEFAGQGTLAFDAIRETNGVWQTVTPPADSGVTGSTFVSASSDAGFTLPFNGQEVKIIHSVGPDHGQWEVLLDGVPALDDDGAPLVINAFSPTARWDVAQAVRAETAGRHTLTVRSSGAGDPASTGMLMAIARVEVQPPERQQSLPLILLIIALVQAAAAVFALLLGRFFAGAAATLNTKRSILLALFIYSVIAAWGFFVDSTVEFWLLAWMVAIVQGGSQALSRSLFSSMSPREKSGEFFGLYGIMEKFSSILGPLVFAGAVVVFGSSRPAILSLIAFFVIGGWLLARVNVPEGQRVAREEDAAVLRSQGLVT